jgi:ubiquinone/menaquinone biosynthesis C-methylase UbiE
MRRSKIDREHLNQQKWDRRAATFDQRRFDYFRWFQRPVIRLVDLRPGLHFLDLGCGTGWAVRRVARRLHDQGEFYGIDLSGAMIAAAQAQSGDFQHVHFYQASASQIPLASSSIEALICTHSFHHYVEPAKVLAEIQRLLKPGGRLYILDVTADDFLLRWIDKLVRRWEREHVHFYSSREFRSLFAEAGLIYEAWKWTVYPVKIHIGLKEAGDNLQFTQNPVPDGHLVR